MTGEITYERINIDKLKIDPKVQRLLDVRKISKMAAKGFDPVKLGVIVVCRRNNGDVYISDGQHRVAFAASEGYDEPLMCEVHHGLTLAQEADLFLGLNDQSNPTALTKFLVSVVRGDDDSTGIDSIVHSHGWEVAAGASGIAAIDTVEWIYRSVGLAGESGADILDQVLTVITRAWGYDVKGVHASILKGTAQLYLRFGSSVDSEKLIVELQKHSPVELLGKARQLQAAQGGTLPAAYAKVLVGLHNNRKRTHLLPEWVWTR